MVEFSDEGAQRFISDGSVSVVFFGGVEEVVNAVEETTNGDTREEI